MTQSVAASYRLERRLADFVRVQGVLRDGEQTLLLLSGGADSMALLHLLPVVQHRLGLSLRYAALHVDYAARGADSDRDRAIVEQACDDLEVPLHMVRLEHRLEGGSFQERARELRYWHARELAKAHAYDVVVAAHNRDDQAETVLYRLTKYASPRGLVGMRPRERRLARPLLCLGAAEIRAYCEAHGIAYGVDRTNELSCYARNVIRREALPPLRRINPRVTETLAVSAEMAAAETAVLAAVTEAALQRVARQAAAEELAVLDVEALRAEEAPLRALVVHEWVRAAMGGEALVGHRVVEALLRLTVREDDAGRTSLGRGLEVVRSGGRLRLRRRSPAHSCDDVVLDRAALSTALAADGLPVDFCGRRFRVRLERGPALERDAAHPRLGLAAVPERVVFGHPKRGEGFVPLGLGAETTVLRYLAGARVPAEARGRALVLDIEGAVAWVAFAGPGAPFCGRVAQGFRVEKKSGVTLHVHEEEE